MKDFYKKQKPSQWIALHLLFWAGKTTLDILEIFTSVYLGHRWPAHRLSKWALTGNFYCNFLWLFFFWVFFQKSHPSQNKHELTFFTYISFVNFLCRFPLKIETPFFLFDVSVSLKVCQLRINFNMHGMLVTIDSCLSGNTRQSWNYGLWAVCAFYTNYSSTFEPAIVDLLQKLWFGVRTPDFANRNTIQNKSAH